MDQDLHVDEDFKRSFNDGYTLAKELGMNKDSLKDLAAGNHRMEAMKKGMEQFEKDVEMKKERDRIVSRIKAQDKDISDKAKIPQKDKDKGMDKSL